MTLLFYFRFITIDSYGEFATIDLIDTNFHILWRVWSWLRVNAGGVPNTCKSNDEASSLLEVD